MNRKAPISAVLATVAIMIFAVACTCVKDDGIREMKGNIDGVMFNAATNLYDIRVVCEDGVTLVIPATKDVAEYYMDPAHKQDQVVYQRWYKCKDWRWLADTRIGMPATEVPEK